MNKKMDVDAEVATSTFTHLAIETQIHELWKEISKARLDTSKLEAIKDWELVRLIEVHNKLDIESIRQQEKHLKLLLDSLHLEQIGAKVTITGGLKAHVTPSFPKKSIKKKSASISSFTGFVDPMYEATESLASIHNQTSEILLERKREINQTLILLARKKRLTSEEMELRNKLICELKELNNP